MGSPTLLFFLEVALCFLQHVMACATAADAAYARLRDDKLLLCLLRLTIFSIQCSATHEIIAFCVVSVRLTKQ